MKVYGVDFGFDETKYLAVYDTDTGKFEIFTYKNGFYR